MNNASLELGGTNWAEKDGNILGYSVGDTSGKYSPQEFTFARGSNLSATRIDRAGLIVKGRENVLLQSNQFDTTWTLNVNASAASGQSGYDGSNDAWLLSTIGGQYSSARQVISSSGVHTFSVYAKAGSLSAMALSINVTGNATYQWFDLSNGTLGVNQDNNEIDATIELVNGTTDWYRCSVTHTGSLIDVRIFPTLINTFSTTAGNILIQDAQFELGLAASSYIESGATNGTAGVLENTPRLNYTTGVANPYLLLEPSRTNLIAQSEYFGDSYWTKIGASVVGGYSSPEGLSNAYKLVEDTSTGTHRVDSIEWIFITGGTTVTQSVYVKANGRTIVGLQDNALGAGHAVFNLSTVTVLTVYGVSAKIETLPNGWFRISYTFVSGGSGSMPYKTGIYALDTYTSGTPLSNTYTGDGTSGLYIYGAQLEIGSYPTSYIPTYSVSATRAADSCSKTNASGEIGQTEGTMYAEINFVDNNTDSMFMTIGDGTSNNRIHIGYDKTSDWIYCNVKAAGLQQALITSSSPSDGIKKIAVAYKQNDYVVYINGVSVGADTNANVPTLTKIYIGGYFSAGFEHSVKQNLLYKERLTNAELATLTTI